MSRIRWYGPSLVLMLTLIVAMVAGPSLVRNVVYAQTDARIHLVQDQLANNASLKDISESFRKVADVVEPSVVHIQVYTTGRPANQGRSPRDMLRRFFGPDNPFEDQVPQGQDPGQGQDDEDGGNYPNAPREYGSGSGWVYDHDGHIVTNNHVVRLPDGSVAKDIRVRFHNGMEKAGTVVSTDPKTDIAVVKVDSDNLHPAAIATDAVHQGEIVFAFGSPFSRFDFSMSQGIVSAQGRQLGIISQHGERGYEDFIQTDAAINPGNSGGPLTNIYGQVVGMNSAIASRNGSFNGIGFAIPADMISNVVDQIIESGSVSRGYLGIYIDDLDPKMAQTFGYDGQGVLVVNPIKDSPGAKAGLKAGDIITAVDGKSVASADDLRYTIANYAPDTKVSLKVFRDGESRDMTLTLGTLPTQGPQLAQGPEDPSLDQPGARKGMEALRKIGIVRIDTFTQDKAQQLGAPFKPGVIVLGVRPGSYADAAGIARGMIVTGIMNQSIKTGSDLVDAINKLKPGQPVRLRVLIWNPQDESFVPRYVVVELPE